MAERGQNLLGKLADAGEEAIAKVGDVPGLARISQSVTGLRERMDDLQKRVRGLEDIEKRLGKLEKRVDELSGGRGKATRSRAAGTRRAPAKAAPKRTSS